MGPAAIRAEEPKGDDVLMGGDLKKETQAV